MHFLSHLKNKSQLLTQLIDISIINSAQKAEYLCQHYSSKRAEEPDFIANLVLEFAPNLFKILTLLFKQSKFTLSSIYCHQKPLANYGGIKNPEIGDIIFAIIHTDRFGKKTCNALLMQAKISQEEDFIVPSSDEHQLFLYTEWPKFTYIRPEISFKGATRDIYPKSITQGAQYLLIDNHPRRGLSGIPGTFPMGCATANKHIILDKNLSEELTDFLKFKTGRGFDYIDSYHDSDDWTRLVWDLIGMANIKSKRKNAGLIGKKDFERGSIADYDGLSFITLAKGRGVFNDIETSDIFNTSASLQEDGGGGVSLILIEVSDIEGHENNT